MTKTINAMVVDDDDIYQYLAKKELEKLDTNISVLGFSDGKKALQFLNDNSENSQALPDIIFLDINMPILNGWLFVESLQAMTLAKGSQIYVVSSSFDRRDIEKSKEYDLIKDYLVKPFKRPQLKKIIDTL